MANSYISATLRKLVIDRALDPVTRSACHLFHPRRDSWAAHFAWQGVRVVGLTPVGRTTIDALSMNRDLVLAIREVEAALGRHPQT